MNKLFTYIYLALTFFFIQFNLYNFEIVGSTVLTYLFSTYVLFFFLTLHRIFHILKTKVINKTTVLTFILLSILISIEIINSYKFVFFVEGSLIKSILYSPIYMSIINLFFLYRNIIDFKMGNYFLKKLILLLDFFLVIQLSIVFLVLYDIIPISSINKIQLTNDNTGSYFFALFAIYRINNKADFKSFFTIIFVLIYCIVNDAKGALLLTMITIFYLPIKYFLNYKILFFGLASLFFFILINPFILFNLFPGNYVENLDIFFNLISYQNSLGISYIDTENSILNISNEFYDITNDESMYSSFSRIGALILSFIMTLSSPLFGFGQGVAYSIEFLGNGIHSIIFLLFSSGGIISIIVMYIIFILNFKNIKFSFIEYIGLFFVLFFVNYAYIFYLILFIKKNSY